MSVKKRHSTLSSVPLMELSSGFWAFKTLAAGIELDVFGCISGRKGSTVADLAKALRIAERPAEMLLTGCAALGLLKKKGQRYHNSPLAEQYLVHEKPEYFGGFVEMLDKRLYAGWAKLTEAIRTNRPTTWDPDKQQSLFDGIDPVTLSHFWEAMHSISISTAAVVARAVDFRGFKRLLDGRARSISVSASAIASYGPRCTISRKSLRSPRRKSPLQGLPLVSRRLVATSSRTPTTQPGTT